MKSVSVFTGFTLLLTVKTLRWPCWPSEFRQSYNDTTNSDNYQCVPILKTTGAVNPYQNFICVKRGEDLINIDWKFSDKGPLDGGIYNCININEESMQDYSPNHYVCVNKYGTHESTPSKKYSLPYDFQWSSQGCQFGKFCMKIEEKGSSNTYPWHDNYFCASKTSMECNQTNSLVAFLKCSAVSSDEEKISASLFIVVSTLLLAKSM